MTAGQLLRHLEEELLSTFADFTVCFRTETGDYELVWIIEGFQVDRTINRLCLTANQPREIRPIPQYENL